MVNDITIPGDFFYLAFIPLLAVCVPVGYGIWKRQLLTGSKEEKRNVVTEMSVAKIRDDVTEVKGDIKEMRKDQTILVGAVRDIALLQQNFQELRNDYEKASEASLKMVRDIDNINYRLSSLERRNKNGNGALP
jgi:hypothetical protein